jgi:hypothetical protein
VVGHDQRSFAPRPVSDQRMGIAATNTGQYHSWDSRHWDQGNDRHTAMSAVTIGARNGESHTQRDSHKAASGEQGNELLWGRQGLR